LGPGHVPTCVSLAWRISRKTSARRRVRTHQVPNRTIKSTTGAISRFHNWISCGILQRSKSKRLCFL
jgi:hypothetical protein